MDRQHFNDNTTLLGEVTEDSFELEQVIDLDSHNLHQVEPSHDNLLDINIADCC